MIVFYSNKKEMQHGKVLAITGLWDSTKIKIL